MSQMSLEDEVRNREVAAKIRDICDNIRAANPGFELSHEVLENLIKTVLMGKSEDFVRHSYHSTGRATDTIRMEFLPDRFCRAFARAAEQHVLETVVFKGNPAYP